MGIVVKLLLAFATCALFLPSEAANAEPRSLLKQAKDAQEQAVELPLKKPNTTSVRPQPNVSGPLANGVRLFLIKRVRVQPHHNGCNQQIPHPAMYYPPLPLPIQSPCPCPQPLVQPQFWGHYLKPSLPILLPKLPCKPILAPIQATTTVLPPTVLKTETSPVQTTTPEATPSTTTTTTTNAATTTSESPSTTVASTTVAAPTTSETPTKTEAPKTTAAYIPEATSFTIPQAPSALSLKKPIRPKKRSEVKSTIAPTATAIPSTTTVAPTTLPFEENSICYEKLEVSPSQAPETSSPTTFPEGEETSTGTPISTVSPSASTAATTSLPKKRIQCSTVKFSVELGKLTTVKTSPEAPTATETSTPETTSSEPTQPTQEVTTAIETTPSSPSTVPENEKASTDTPKSTSLGKSAACSTKSLPRKRILCPTTESSNEPTSATTETSVAPPTSTISSNEKSNRNKKRKPTSLSMPTQPEKTGNNQEPLNNLFTKFVHNKAKSVLAGQQDGEKNLANAEVELEDADKSKEIATDDRRGLGGTIVKYGGKIVKDVLQDGITTAIKGQFNSPGNYPINYPMNYPMPYGPQPWQNNQQDYYPHSYFRREAKEDGDTSLESDKTEESELEEVPSDEGETVRRGEGAGSTWTRPAIDFGASEVSQLIAQGISQALKGKQGQPRPQGNYPPPQGYYPQPRWFRRENLKDLLEGAADLESTEEYDEENVPVDAELLKKLANDSQSKEEGAVSKRKWKLKPGIKKFLSGITATIAGKVITSAILRNRNGEVLVEPEYRFRGNQDEKESNQQEESKEIDSEDEGQSSISPVANSDEGIIANLAEEVSRRLKLEGILNGETESDDVSFPEEADDVSFPEEVDEADDVSFPEEADDASFPEEVDEADDVSFPEEADDVSFPEEVDEADDVSFPEESEETDIE